VKNRADDGRSAVVHFEVSPQVRYELTGELRNSGALAANVGSWLAWGAETMTGKSVSDHGRLTDCPCGGLGCVWTYLSIRLQAVHMGLFIGPQTNIYIYMDLLLTD
jgi:hypothetical protein